MWLVRKKEERGWISKEKTCGERNRELKRNIFPKALPYFTCSSFSVTQNRPDYSPKHKTDFISLKFVESRSQISKVHFIPASFHRSKATLKSGTHEGSQHCVGDGFQLSVDHLDDQKFILFTQGNILHLSLKSAKFRLADMCFNILFI